MPLFSCGRLTLELNLFYGFLAHFLAFLLFEATFAITQLKLYLLDVLTRLL
jgi:hypothetical protein